MPIIAMTRETGTLVDRVAECVARALTLSIHHCDIPEQACGEAPLKPAVRCGESVDPLELLGTLAQRKDAGSLKAIEEIVRVALEGNVIICGWAATQFLRGFPNVLRIRVRTTMALRVKRMLAALDVDDPEEALAHILRSDIQAHNKLAQVFGVADREDSALYDLVLDTGRHTVSECADQVVLRLQTQRLIDTAYASAQLRRLALRASAYLWQLEQAGHDAASEAKIAANVRCVSIDVSTRTGGNPRTNVYPFPRFPLREPTG